jgi:ABC-type amino acid transport system permease subunit
MNLSSILLTIAFSLATIMALSGLIAMIKIAISLFRDMPILSIFMMLTMLVLVLISAFVLVDSYESGIIAIPRKVA